MLILLIVLSMLSYRVSQIVVCNVELQVYVGNIFIVFYVLLFYLFNFKLLILNLIYSSDKWCSVQVYKDIIYRKIYIGDFDYISGLGLNQCCLCVVVVECRDL